MGSISPVNQQQISLCDVDIDALLNKPYPAVVCECGHVIFTHKGMIRSRCVDVGAGKALCRCKKWVIVQLVKV